MPQKKWREFNISELFDIFTGSLLAKEDMETGKTPRITASEINNGAAIFCRDIDNKNYRQFNNFISESFLGSVFYQPYKASLDMKIHGLKLKKTELNRHLALFLTWVLRRNFQKFAYGNQLSSTDLPKQKIILPINNLGKPDYGYMEQYMKNIEIVKLRKYQEYLSQIANHNIT